MDIVTVHTTGINFDGLLANVVLVLGVVGFFTGVIIRAVKRSIRDEVAAVVASEVTPVLTDIQNTLKNHDTRIARLEGVEQGKRYAIDAAGVSTKDGRA